MHILIDGTTLSRKTDGLTQYTLSIVLELLRNTSNVYTLICRNNEVPDTYLRKLEEFSEKLHIEYVNISPIGLKRDIQFTIWYKKNKQRFDYLYEPSAQYPLGVKGGVYTIHDILYEEYPEKLGKLSILKKLYLHHVVKRGLKKSSSVVTVSNFTKKEIIKYHGEKYANKLNVIYEGYEHLKNIEVCNDDNKITEKYFLYIGSSRGHKNLHNLFLGYEKANISWKLVIVGRMDRLEEKDKDLVQKINQSYEKIIFTGWIEDKKMYELLSKSAAFVFPSKSEGFGIPILESYFFKIPLLCSDIEVFKEITDDACIMFNPFDIDNIARVLTDFSNRTKDENEELIQRQNKQLLKYSWKKAAENIYNILIS